MRTIAKTRKDFFKFTTNATGESLLENFESFFYVPFTEGYGASMASFLTQSIFIRNFSCRVPGVPGLRKQPEDSIGDIGIAALFNLSIYASIDLISDTTYEGIPANQAVYNHKENKWVNDRSTDLFRVQGTPIFVPIYDYEFEIPINKLFTQSFYSDYVDTNFTASGIRLAVVTQDTIRYDVNNLHPSYLNKPTFLEFMAEIEL